MGHPDRIIPGGFTVNPEKTDPVEKIQERTVFKQKHELEDVYERLFQAAHGPDASMSPEMKKKLTNHLEEMFGNSSAEKKVVQRMLEEEAQRYIKMFS